MAVSPLFRLIECGKVAFDSVSEARRRSLRFQCVNCERPVPRARPGEVQQKICDTCGETAAKAGASIAASGAEKVFELVLRAAFNGKPR